MDAIEQAASSVRHTITTHKVRKQTRHVVERLLVIRQYLFNGVWCNGNADWYADLAEAQSALAKAKGEGNAT